MRERPSAESGESTAPTPTSASSPWLRRGREGMAEGEPLRVWCGVVVVVRGAWCGGVRWFCAKCVACGVRYVITSSRHETLYRHKITRSHHHIIACTPHHHTTMPSPKDTVISSHHHLIIRSKQHTIRPSSNKAITKSSHHILTPSRHQFITPSLNQVVTM